MDQNILKELDRVKTASTSLVFLTTEVKNKVLTELADELVMQNDTILEQNALDLESFSKSDPLYDRILLTKERISDISESLRAVAKLDDPVGDILEQKTLPNDLKLKKIRVPLGVVAVIYEARPNVTVDVFGLTFKSGNACVLKGGSDAKHSNLALIGIIKGVLKANGISEDTACLMTLNRSQTLELLKADEYIDVAIPRGSKNLIRSVRDNATIPTIETGAGVVHTYFSSNGDLNKGIAIINNAKTRRVSVCNALDTLIIDESRLSDLVALTEKLTEANVEIFADNKAYDVLKGYYPEDLLKEAKDEHFGTEFLSLKMSIKTVANLDEALAHIRKFSSKHSEAIISEKQKELDIFVKNVDAAAVYTNTSTAFTDGNEFGLGAEIGISTQKLHARGPMGLNELTSYKWVVIGEGQIR